MSDITTRKKLLFWGFSFTVIFLAAVPSLVLIEKAEEYFHFLSGWDPGTLKQTKVNATIHNNNFGTKNLPEVEFVGFQLLAPKAQKVHLAGNFNAWRHESLPLVRKKNGMWETFVPLPFGTYYYSFLVDGVWTLDPKAAQKTLGKETQASIVRVP